MSEKQPNMPENMGGDQYSDSLRWVNPKDGSLHIFRDITEKMQFLAEQSQKENK